MKHYLEDNYTRIATDKGNMYVSFNSFAEIKQMSEKAQGKIYLLRAPSDMASIHSRFQTICELAEPYDRMTDYINNQEVASLLFAGDYCKSDILRIAYEQCYKSRLERYMTAQIDSMEELNDILRNLHMCGKIIDYMAKEDFLVVFNSLDSDIIERYPMNWFNDKFMYYIALALPE